MDALFAQTLQAANNGLYYLALFSALSIPDICGAMDSTDGIAKRSRYEGWFNQHGPTHLNMTASDCYNLRCSILHQGITQHPKSNYKRIVFTQPDANFVFLHNNVMNDALNLDIQLFCAEMVGAAQNWITKVQLKPHYQANLAKFMTLRPDGLAPYIVGKPVIT